MEGFLQHYLLLARNDKPGIPCGIANRREDESAHDPDDGNHKKDLNEGECRHRPAKMQAAWGSEVIKTTHRATKIAQVA